MSGTAEFPGRIPAPYLEVGSSSFVELLGSVAPELLPGRRPLPPGDMGDAAPHGTTIVALRCNEGVVMAGDRRATQGNMISLRDIQKVFPADAYSLIGIAGTAGLGVEMIRLFQAELEHFEKLEGNALSLHGKANKLANMIRGNLGIAMQGLAVLPLFAGFDTDAPDAASAGRIFSYDVVGGIYEEREYDAIGSGSIFAKSALKKRFQSEVDATEATRLAIEALYDAADDDSATGGPDLTRKLFPTVFTATADGAKRVPDAEIEAVSRAVVAARLENPGG
ncbi:proteasome subunit beta [Stackebrandtia nassauensis]|uniref:Proteasome subunit beta n=1 Tax=Stackebrandtia nassauensis (strain DSM 44728 / CIP 108903 / NRRL B-16338 / NBRC 102104 / LLR-40K-21) TaxID=446470 RepID=PSB_STANL|nr:RecName: Full=Proteasome subunit beta; AltName: Full=20S proteasome beta subunit; AltName: Full=Proteasome core protein PrcB; Flags: Precursor [Stackebrandtia nassauensis DSM 44728]ADD44106.1 20S proteasome A and B subunits [Stackebrandtia nassauensis DSM 44728]